MKQNLLSKGLKAQFILAFMILYFHQGSLLAQSLSLPTDRARIHVEQITDPTDATKKLKVLRTDANTPLRGASPWITNKSTKADNKEISASFFKDQAIENLNSVRIIWFQAWFDIYARQNGTLPNPAEITDFNDPVQVKHCLDVLEAAVNHASENGMYACINFHTAWKGPINLPYAKQFWSVVVPYFANRTHVIYEQANEPVSGSNSFTAANDRGTDMNCQVELYQLIRNAAPNTFCIVLTPPSCEGDFTANNDFIKGVKRFESLVGTVDWSKTAVGYHTYYMGWDNATNTALKTSVPMRAIHRAYPAMSTEVNWPEGVVNTLNTEPSLDGEKFQVQTHERLGIGWWLWAVSHPDNSAEGWYANFKKLKSDAISKGYFWGKDQVGPADHEAPTVPSELAATGVSSNRFQLSWKASADNLGVSYYAIFNGSNYLGSSAINSYDFIGLTPGIDYILSIKAVDNAGNFSAASSEFKVSTLAADAIILFTEAAPVIDGTKEAAWSGTVYNIGNMVKGSITNSDDLSGTWTAIYDNTSLYFFVDVMDDQIKVNGPEWYLDDRIEIFIDADGDRSAAFTDRDYQYYIRPDETKFTETHKGAIANIQLANVTIIGGYRLEAKIPFKTLGITPESGWKMGIDVIVADDDGGNEDAILVWNNNNGETWTSPTLFGFAQLGPNPDVIAPEVPTQLTASAITASGFKLTWLAPADHIGVTGYEVFNNGISAGKTTATSFDVKGLTSNSVNKITIKARDAAGNWSGASTLLTISTLKNIALNKSTTTSSVYSANYSGAKAVDGIASSSWRSVGTDLNPSYSVDLGAVYTLNSIKLTWSTAYAKDYLIEISTDGTLFTTLKTLTAQNGGTDELTGLIQSARYVRMTVNTRSSTSGVILIDFEVYGETVTGLKTTALGDFMMFPNPLHNQSLTVFFYGFTAPENTVLSLFDIHGQIVFQKNIGQEKSVQLLETRSLQSGIYFLHASNGLSMLSRKLIVQ
jgi:chitodextrinase